MHRAVERGNRHRRRRAFLAIFGAVAATSIARAQSSVTQTITFDDLDASNGGSGYVTIPDNYAGFNWYNFFCANAADLTQQLGPNGFMNGLVSPPNVAFNGFGLPTLLTAGSGGLFNLDSLYMTAAWNDGLQVTLDGDLNGTVVDSATVTLNTSGPTLETFDFTGVDSVQFSASGGTPNAGFSQSGENFALDNLTLTTSTSSLVWTLPGSGAWDVAANWSQTLTPAIVNDVTIAPVNSLTVTGPSTSAIVNSLTLGGGGGNATLALQPTGNLSVTNGLSVHAGGSLVTGGANVTVASLSIDGNGIVNINSALTINYGSPGNDPVSAVVGYLKGGYGGGAWTGTSGIVSTSVAAGGSKPILSVGYADGNADNGTPAGPNQIVVRFTLAGDANLDGHVNSADLLAVVQNFNKTGTDWARGDFTYITSGPSTTSADLLLVIQNFNQTLPSPAGSALPIGELTIPLGESALEESKAVQVPEPSAFGMAELGMAALFSALRRRRQNTKMANQDSPRFELG